MIMEQRQSLSHLQSKLGQNLVYRVSYPYYIGKVLLIDTTTIDYASFTKCKANGYKYYLSKLGIKPKEKKILKSWKKK